ncbi:MAG: GNAT family N-acetyltransferase [Deltaproteobacteria bacterium]|nr:GNAT family N-acetyltransferase [Deltaproteobacteria bacterium]
MAPNNTSDSPFEVKEYASEDYPHLLHMYDLFSPKGKFQGMPPGNGEARRKWIQHLTENGQDFLAWEGSRVVGHGVLLPDFNKFDAEYLIFVVQSDRGKGVGTALTRQALKWARLHGIRVVWLTVDTYNFRAIHLYKKFGFNFPEPFDHAPERLMILRLGEDTSS